MDRKCPLCREKIPPSKEMVTQLKYWRLRKSQMEAEGDIFSQEYMIAKSEVEKLEREIGDCTETIDYSDEDNNYVILPMDISKAARENNIQKVLDWLGPPPVDKQRVNARCPDHLDFTLMFAAVLRCHSALLSILLQLGADVDSVCAVGGTPFGACFRPEFYAQARVLLEWGSEISNNSVISKDEFITKALRNGNSSLVNLLKSEFGGRRCEIISLPNHPDLIGKTCVVEKYLPDKERYKVIFEVSEEVGLVGPQNLKRRDRTPDDCGYYISYENGRSARHDFASKEECQAFQASLAEEDAAAEARAEEAAASLLAELNIESSGGGRSKHKGKRKGKGKKKGRK